jgi:threonine synthase
MKYYSLNHNALKVSFKSANTKLAPDKGLYFPETITPLSSDFFDTIENLSNEEIAFEAIKQFIGDEIPAPVLKEMPIHCALISRLSRWKKHLFLELFHGPQWLSRT